MNSALSNVLDRLQHGSSEVSNDAQIELTIFLQGVERSCGLEELYPNDELYVYKLTDEEMKELIEYLNDLLKKQSVDSVLYWRILSIFTTTPSIMTMPRLLSAIMRLNLGVYSESRSYLLQTINLCVGELKCNLPFQDRNALVALLDEIINPSEAELEYIKGIRNNC